MRIHYINRRTDMELTEIMKKQSELDSLLIDNAATGKKIRTLCENHGINCSDLAEMLGFTGHQAVYNWSEGKTKPTLENMIKISYLLGIDVKEIVQLSSVIA